MLRLESICKSYNIGRLKLQVLKNVSLEVKRGEIISVTGKSGAGKTTLLNIIAGLTKPDRGTVFLNNKRLFYFLDIMPARFRNQKIGFVFQTFRLLQNETVYFNVLLPLIISGWIGKKKRDFAEGLLKKLEIWDHKDCRVSMLSGGQKQRVAFARALINDPDLILADEPTANLDVETAKEVGKLLISISREGKAVFLVTHQDYLFRHSDRIYELKDGFLEGRKLCRR